MSWKLPTSLEIGGVGFSIRTDFRDILTILQAYNDPDLPDDAKHIVMLQILYEDFEKITDENVYEAIQKGIEFIDQGRKDDHQKPPIMDWEYDSDIIVPAINKVAGCEVRALPYLHWWTFLGYYMEIGEGLFSNVINIRHKKMKGEKLEKWEKEFERDNKDLIVLKKQVSEEEKEVRAAEKAALDKLLGI